MKTQSLRGMIQELQRRAARARTSGPMRLRTTTQAPQQALAQALAEGRRMPWEKAAEPIGTVCEHCVTLLVTGFPPDLPPGCVALREVLGPHPRATA